MKDYQNEQGASGAISISIHCGDIHISGGTFCLTDMLGKAVQKLAPQHECDSTRTALLRLFQESVVTEAKQWYAIFCVLSQCAGYPEAMPEFCDRIDALQLELDPPCVYENWRKVQNELPELPKNVKEWNPNNPKVNPNIGIGSIPKYAKQLLVAKRLLELLEQ